jgi:hypothetical protein
MGQKHSSLLCGDVEKSVTMNYRVGPKNIASECTSEFQAIPCRRMYQKSETFWINYCDSLEPTLWTVFLCCISINVIVLLSDLLLFSLSL